MSLTPKEKKDKKPKKYIQGKILLDRIFERDADKGAVFVETSGIQGCGKTSLNLGFADRIMEDNPEEIIYWRESVDNPCQWNKIGKGKYQILSEKDNPIEILEITNNLRPAKIPVYYFKGFKELDSMVEPGMLNVVYFKYPSRWIDLVNYLCNSADWQSMFWDEYEDVCPSRCSNAEPERQWSKNELLANSLKKIRKSRISIFGNTQSNMDADVRVRSKVMFWIYLYGARRDKLSPVSKSAISSLKIGTGWVDHGHSLFGQFTFPPYVPMEQIYTVRNR